MQEGGTVPPSTDFDTVLVVDFGAQYAQLIARRVRECQVYSEIVPSTTPAAEILARKPAAIILSGGPASVYAPGAPPLPGGADLLRAGIPVLGICYGFQLMVAGLGGVVAHTGSGEYGATQLDLLPGGPAQPGGQLLTVLAGRQQVWMSHGDTATGAPPGFAVTARTAATPAAALEDPDRRLYGVQFHPEVLHTEHGTALIRRFLELAGCRPDWTMGSIIDEQVGRIRAQVGSAGAICGLSGGVDSAVAAAIVQRAIGSQLTCVFVDHGLLRRGEAEQVEKDFVAATGVDLKVVDAGPDVPGRAGRGDRPGREAQDHRAGVHPGLRAGRPGDHRGRGQPGHLGRLPGPGHPVPGRSRVGRRHRGGQHQVTPQCRRAAQRPELPARRAAAGAVQG